MTRKRAINLGYAGSKNLKQARLSMVTYSGYCFSVILRVFFIYKPTPRSSETEYRVLSQGAILVQASERSRNAARMSPAVSRAACVRLATAAIESRAEESRLRCRLPPGTRNTPKPVYPARRFIVCSSGEVHTTEDIVTSRGLTPRPTAQNAFPATFGAAGVARAGAGCCQPRAAGRAAAAAEPGTGDRVYPRR